MKLFCFILINLDMSSVTPLVSLSISLNIKFLLNKRIYHSALQVKLYRSQIKTDKQKALFVSRSQYTNFLFSSSLLPNNTLVNNNNKKIFEPVLRTASLRLSKIQQHRIIACFLPCFPHHKVFSTF